MVPSHFIDRACIIVDCLATWPSPRSAAMERFNRRLQSQRGISSQFASLIKQIIALPFLWPLVEAQRQVDLLLGMSSLPICLQLALMCRHDCFVAGQASVAVVPTLQALSLPMTHAAGSHDVTGAAPSPLVSLSPDTHSPTTSGSQMNALFNTLCSPYAPLWSAAVAVTSNIIEQAAQASISLPAPLCFVRVKVSDLVHRICVLQSMNSALNFHSICYH